MRDRFENAILQSLPNTVVNSYPDAPTQHDPAAHAPAGQPHPHQRPRQRLWNTSNLGFPGLEADAILLSLSERGVCASAGAACSSGSLDPSPVLLAMGVPDPIAHGSVRFSLTRYTQDHEIDQAARIVPEVISRLNKTMLPPPPNR